jgi:hypothetical protein
MFTGVLRGCFPWVNYGIATPWRVCLVGQPWVSAQKGYKFWSDRFITLKFLQGFLEAIFLGVDMEWLLGDEDVLSFEMEYQLKRAINFYPTVGSSSNFYMGFQRLFSLGKLWNRCSVTRTSGRQPWVSAQRAIAFDPTVGSRLNVYTGFQRLFSLG